MALTKVPSNLDSITATTQSQGDGSTNVATTAYVDTGLSALIDSAPGNLNTLNELAAAMNDNASFFSTVLPLSGGTMTGNIAHASDLTLDLGGDLIVDVDGDNVWFDAAGTRFLSISQVSSDVYIGAEQNDKDLIFRGKDGSSTITALTLDMSEAGKATFNNAIVASGISQFADVNIPDNNAIRFGSSQDLQIYHDGTNSHITNNTGYTTLRTATTSGYLYLHGDNVQFRGQSANEPMITAVCNGEVTLYYDNSAKLATTSTGTHTSGTSLSLKTTSSTANDRAGAGFTATESSTDGDRRAVMYLDADNGAFGTGDSGAYFYMEKKGAGGEVNFINQDTADMNFQTGGAHKRITIQGAGNVGIGTTAPDLTLHVDGTNALPATSGTTPNGMLTLRAKSGSSSHGLFMGVSNASPWGSWLQAQDVNNLATEYPLLLNPNGGNVGIAVNDPDARLEIKSAGGGSESALKVTDSSDNNVFIQTGGGRAIFHYGPVLIGAETDIMHANMDDLQVGNAVGNRGMTIASGNGSYGTLAFADGSSGNAAYRGFVEYFHNEDSLRLGTSGTEKLRIDSTGVVMISTSITKSAGDNPADENSSVIGPGYLYLQRDDSANINQIVFGKDGQIAGRIVTTTATSLVSASDYRMKENVDYTWDATTRLKQLKPARYNWIADETNTLEDGFLAHEVDSVVPNAVFGEKDAVDSNGNPEMQGVDSSKLIPLLVKTIQELEARIATLEG